MGSQQLKQGVSAYLDLMGLQLCLEHEMQLPASDTRNDLSYILDQVDNNCRLKGLLFQTGLALVIRIDD